MSFNPRLKATRKNKEKDLDYYLSGLADSNRYILSECITLIESNNSIKKDLGYEIISNLQPVEGTIRIGITGSPGVGKSTLLDTLGMKLIERGKKVAILAVDPSSSKSRGSILGDKTRMDRLSKEDNAYIRPTASGLYLGGIAANTREAIILAEAAGYDVIIIETVGVGQSETHVSSLVDVFLLMILPGAGDDIQGIKRGIMELADIIMINKADGERKELAQLSKKQLLSAISLMHPKIKDYKTKIITGSGLQDIGIDQLLNEIDHFLSHSKEIDFFEKNRMVQDLQWYEDQYRNLILNELMTKTEIYTQVLHYKEKLLAGEINPIEAIVNTRHLILQKGIV